MSEDIPEDLDVPDEVVMLLYLGIGIYSPRSTILNPEKKDGIDTRYTEKVVEMCSSGYISFLFADRSIVYGNLGSCWLFWVLVLVFGFSMILTRHPFLMRL